MSEGIGIGRTGESKKIVLKKTSLRRSIEFFEKKPQKMILKNTTNYKPLKKTMLSFKEGLHFIHTLCRSKPRIQSKTRTVSKSVISKKSATIHINVTSPTGKIGRNRSQTPTVTKFKLIPRVFLPKISVSPVIKSPLNCNLLQKPAKNESTDVEDLKGWLVDSLNN